MFGPISTDGIPTLNTFAEAQRYFDSIKPWRGSNNEESRPLTGRRDKHKMIVRRNNGDIACRLYNTDVVVYHRDGDISIKRYDTHSTVEFANRLLPWELRTTMHLGQMWVCMDTLQPGLILASLERKTRHYLREGLEPLRFRRIMRHNAPQMAYECVNPHAHMPAQRRMLDKERTKQVRGQLKAFEQWAKAVLGFNEGRPPQDTQHTLSARSFFMDDIEPSDYPYVLNHYTRHDYYRRCRVMQPNWVTVMREDAYKHANAFELHPVPITELPAPSRWGIV